MRGYVIKVLAKAVGVQIPHPFDALFKRLCSNPACVVCKLRRPAEKTPVQP